MPTKKYLELQGHSDEDLRVELQGAQREYRQMRFDHYTKGIDDPSRIRELRRDIARLQTESRRRELGELGTPGRAGSLSRRQRQQQRQAAK